MIRLVDLLSEDLRRWVKEKWTDQHGRPCGNDKTKGVKKCRPSRRVSKDTPKTWSSFDKKEKQDTFESFADTREAGAEKIATTAHKKGGLALLTWHHFKVKLPYYKRAAAGRFDLDKAKREFDATYKKIST